MGACLCRSPWVPLPRDAVCLPAAPRPQLRPCHARATPRRGGAASECVHLIEALTLSVDRRQRVHVQEAEAAFRRALAGKEKALGATDVTVGVTLNSLGSLLAKKVGRWAPPNVQLVLVELLLSGTLRSGGAGKPTLPCPVSRRSLAPLPHHRASWQRLRRCCAARWPSEGRFPGTSMTPQSLVTS